MPLTSRSLSVLIASRQVRWRLLPIPATVYLFSSSEYASFWKFASFLIVKHDDPSETNNYHWLGNLLRGPVNQICFGISCSPSHIMVGKWIKQVPPGVTKRCENPNQKSVLHLKCLCCSTVLPMIFLITIDSCDAITQTRAHSFNSSLA